MLLTFAILIYSSMLKYACTGGIPLPIKYDSSKLFNNKLLIIIKKIIISLPALIRCNCDASCSE